MFDGHLEIEGNRGCLATAMLVIILGLFTVWSGLTKPDWFEVGLGLLIAFIALILFWRIAHDVDEESPSQSILGRLLHIGLEIFDIKTTENHDQ